MKPCSSNKRGPAGVEADKGSGVNLISLRCDAFEKLMDYGCTWAINSEYWAHVFMICNICTRNPRTRTSGHKNKLQVEVEMELGAVWGMKYPLHGTFSYFASCSPGRRPAVE